MKRRRPTFDPWPSDQFSPRSGQPINWLPWMVIGILGVGVGISALLIWSA